MMGTTRRAFLAYGGAGAAMMGIAPRLSGMPGVDGATGPPAPSSSALPTDEERRRLIAAAHFGRKSAATGSRGMAICTHPLAANDAIQMLREGGNACDAALAASITQTVVEPHMTGITGVLSLLYYDAASGAFSYMNGSHNAPLARIPGFSYNDVAGGRGVAVPGFWAGFQAAHEKLGRLPRPTVMRGAVHLARNGFETHPFLWGEIFAQCHRIGLTEQGREIFLPAGALPRPGEMLFQKRAADTLERLAEQGDDFFYHGDFAEEFCRVVKEAGGVITREDLERYDVRWQEPARGSYRGYQVVGSPPPDNGGSHVIEILNMVELLDLERLGPPTDDPEVLFQMVRIHDAVYTEGGKQRDPETHPLPLETILSKDYARMRFELLQMGAPKEVPEAPPPAGSNHVTVVDGDGNIATILHSCMSMPWSNGLFAGGVTIVAGGAHFHRVMPEPGHRISAYVAPNMVLKDGKPILASGSPSVSLLQNIVQNTTNILDFGFGIEQSVHRPRFGGSSLIEVDIDEKVRKAAEARGLTFDVVNPWNWMHGSFEGIAIDPATGTTTACGDPRRTAQALAV
jgi:gamma-glutamyltranspeptidase/glutathione hydrolase